jgi:hypothetical protein
MISAALHEQGRFEAEEKQFLLLVPRESDWRLLGREGGCLLQGIIDASIVAPTSTYETWLAPTG